MRRRMRRRFMYGSHCPWCGAHRWPEYADTEAREEEIEDLKEHIAHLKDDLKAAEEGLKELEKAA